MNSRRGLVSMIVLGTLLLSGTIGTEGCGRLPSDNDVKGAYIGLAAAVVVGTIVLVEVHNSHHTIKGCVSNGPNGMQLMNIGDKRTYTLLGATSRTQVGDIVQLRGDKERAQDSRGDREFVVKKMRKDYGPCESNPEQATTASLSCSVVDASTHRPISGATVVAGAGSAITDGRGNCMLNNLPGGAVSAAASAPGYERKVIPLNLDAGYPGQVRFELQRHSEGDLERSIGQTGAAALYGVQFDTNSSTLRPDSTTALSKALTVILNRPDSHWIIAGHTDNQGSAELNQRLSQARAAAVVDWLVAHGVAPNRLTAQGFGASQPVADNSTEEGRAQNRRVELRLVK